MRYNLRSDFDITSVFSQLEMVGGVSIPILCERDRLELVAEALTCRFTKRPYVVGAAKVRQDMSGVDSFRHDSPFFTLRDDWEVMIKNKLRELPHASSLFATPLCFNSLALQRYDPGSLGITPHRDSSCNINLICLFVLTGYSLFGLCEDRQSAKIITILDDTPGNVILLRAKGFNTTKPQPFHFLTDIPESRISFGLRQVA